MPWKPLRYSEELFWVTAVQGIPRSSASVLWLSLLTASYKLEDINSKCVFLKETMVVNLTTSDTFQKDCG